MLIGINFYGGMMGGGMVIELYDTSGYYHIILLVIHTNKNARAIDNKAARTK